MESLDFVDIGVGQPNESQHKLRILFQRLFEQFNRLTVVLLAMEFPQHPSMQVKIVSGQIFGRSALEIGAFIGRKFCLQSQGYLLCQIGLNGEHILQLAVVGGAPEPLVSASIVKDRYDFNPIFDPLDGALQDRANI